MHGLDNNKQWINVININTLFVVVQPMQGKEKSAEVI
jgi:hypothetical protein